MFNFLILTLFFILIFSLVEMNQAIISLVLLDSDNIQYLDEAKLGSALACLLFY